MLESYGMQKVTFELGSDKVTVATNDSTIRDFLNPHCQVSTDATCAAEESNHAIPNQRSDDTAWFSQGLCDAWQNSCSDAEAHWTSVFRIASDKKKVIREIPSREEKI